MTAATPSRSTVLSRIDDVITRHSGDLLDLTRSMMSINSQIPPFGDEREIVDFLRDRVAQLGLGSSSIIASDPTRPNLIVRVPGAAEGPTLGLCGHVDTKPVGDARDQWRTDPLTPTVVGPNLVGLGASDMKAAVAAMVYGTYAAQQAGALAAGNVTLVLVADEEAGANYGARVVAPLLAQEVDACLIGEPSGWGHDWQGLHLVSRGLCCFRIRVGGTQMHSSLSDRMPCVNASLRMADLMRRLPEELQLEWPAQMVEGITPTLNVGVIVRAGVFYGVVPGEAEFACDLRTLPGMTREAVDQALRAWVESVRAEEPDLALELSYEPSLEWIDSAQIAADHRLVMATQHAAAAVLGQAPPLSVFPGTTDAPWFANAGIPTLPSFGPGVLTTCHGPNEYVSLTSIVDAARIYAHTIAHYLMGDEERADPSA